MGITYDRTVINWWAVKLSTCRGNKQKTLCRRWHKLHKKIHSPTSVGVKCTMYPPAVWTPTSTVSGRRDGLKTWTSGRPREGSASTQNIAALFTATFSNPSPDITTRAASDIWHVKGLPTSEENTLLVYNIRNYYYYYYY